MHGGDCMFTLVRAFPLEWGGENHRKVGQLWCSKTVSGALCWNFCTSTFKLLRCHWHRNISCKKYPYIKCISHCSKPAHNTNNSSSYIFEAACLNLIYTKSACSVRKVPACHTGAYHHKKYCWSHLSTNWRTGKSSWLAAASEDSGMWPAAMLDGAWCCAGNDIAAPVTGSMNWRTELAGDGW